jgi:hypothetical protein
VSELTPGQALLAGFITGLLMKEQAATPMIQSVEAVVRDGDYTGEIRVKLGMEGDEDGSDLLVSITPA